MIVSHAFNSYNKFNGPGRGSRTLAYCLEGSSTNRYTTPGEIAPSGELNPGSCFQGCQGSLAQTPFWVFTS